MHRIEAPTQNMFGRRAPAELGFWDYGWIELGVRSDKLSHGLKNAETEVISVAYKLERDRISLNL